MVLSLGFSNFQIFNCLVADSVETINVHSGTNVTKIGETVAEISHLTIFKIAAVCHLGFLKFNFLNSW